MLKKSAIISAMLCCSLVASAETVLYPAVPGMRTSEVYSVVVNGEEAWVYMVPPDDVEVLRIQGWIELIEK